LTLGSSGTSTAASWASPARKARTKGMNKPQSMVFFGQRPKDQEAVGLVARVAGQALAGQDG
jgi:hypothetical protein